MEGKPTAESFIKKLKLLESPVAMGDIFALAKEFKNMEPPEIEKLLTRSSRSERVGAVSIMDFQARDKNTSLKRRKRLFDLYLKCHHKIDTWGLVDRSAPYVIGGYLINKPRDILYQLARSKHPMERRTAIVSTYFFIRQNNITDTFKIAELLVHDSEPLVQKAVGSWTREAGKRDQEKLLTFLGKYASTMPRVMLRYAIEKLPAEQKEHYMNLK